MEFGNWLKRLDKYGTDYFYRRSHTRSKFNGPLIIPRISKFRWFLHQEECPIKYTPNKWEVTATCPYPIRDFYTTATIGNRGFTAFTVPDCRRHCPFRNSIVVFNQTKVVCSRVCICQHGHEYPYLVDIGIDILGAEHLSIDGVVPHNLERAHYYTLFCI